jgi:hypothetical protein
VSWESRVSTTPFIRMRSAGSMLDLLRVGVFYSFAIYSEKGWGI